MDEVRKLAGRLAALPEPAMRRVVLAETLGAAPPAELVRTLHELVRRARVDPRPPYSVAVHALAQALGDAAALTYEARAALYAAAKEAGLEDVARMLFAAATGPAPEPGAPEPEQPVQPRGRPLTLGERKALARAGRRDLLQHLMRDPDAAVIRILVENPRLTERDIVFIAARRPVRGDVLRVIFDSRWLTRYDVKRTLIQNPYTPGDLAVRLLPTLSEPDLRAVAADPNLGAPVRAQADVLLAERRRPPEP